MKYFSFAIVAWFAGAPGSVRAQDVVTLLSPGSFQPSIEQLIPSLESKTGRKVQATFGAGGTNKQRVVRGDVFDVIILQPPYPEVLASGNVVAASATPLASVALGVAVRKGASKPDLSTPEAVKRAFLDAKSVSYPEEVGATAAQQFHGVLEKLGIAAQMGSKLKPGANGGAVLALVAKGDAEIGVTFMTGMNRPGIDVAGALPRELAPPVEFVGFVGAHAKDPAAAKAILDGLSSPEAQEVYKARGMQAGLHSVSLHAASTEFQIHNVAQVQQAAEVLPVDVNHDGKIDLVVLSAGTADLVWFENPNWERHVIAPNLHGMIYLAAWDTDGDGIPEIVVAHEFSSRPKQSPGVISLLKHHGDPRQPWSMSEIDRVPATHRMRVADIEGSGKKVLVMSPLAAADAEPPDYRGHVPLFFYRPSDWKRQLIDDSNQGLVHAVVATDWDHAGRDSILIGGFTGVRLYQLGKDNRWTHTELLKGDPAPWPKSGVSEVAVGHLGKERFLLTAEPWHGNQLVTYRQRDSVWQREVIDTLPFIHTIIAADFTGDGRDQLVSGSRDMPGGLYVYSFDGKQWNRELIDDGIAPASCASADLDGDGKPDIVCAGMTTNNVRWYENLNPAKSARR